MLRNLAAALALTLLSQMVMALGLGSIKPSSRLNEPFDGRIEILGTTAADADSVFVKLADAEQFERAGVARDAVLLELKFSIVEGKSGADYIQISSREPIREPFLNFLIELNWANGRMVREYTVLLDPPLYDPVRRRSPTPVTTVTRAPEPQAIEPHAFVPEPSASPTVSQIPTPMPVETPAQWEPEPATYSSQSSLGTVQVNDTLWSIASANLPDSATSVQQMMLALLRANPHAFGEGNINVLKRGAILHLPDAYDVSSLTRSEAMAEVKQQNQLWANYRDSVVERVAREPAVQETALEQDLPPVTDAMIDAVPEESPDEATPSDGHLELVAAQAEDGQAGAGGDGIADVTLVREELDAQIQENDELYARIAEANEIIDLMSRQVDIKDDELAALQVRLAELGIEAPTEDGAAGPDSEMDVAATADTEPSDEVSPVSPDEMGDVDISIGSEPATDASDAMDDSGDATSDVEQPEVATNAGEVLTESIFDGIIPKHIASLVPGGALTVLGLIGAALLALLAIIFKLVRGTSANDKQLGVRPDRDDVTELTAIPEDDPITETPVLLVDDDSTSEATTEYGSGLQETSQDLLQTLESSAEELAGGAMDEDPLEEVNVYLAYERFDQAEELVRKVIAEHPNEHNYKLRLLEVFYSSNNKSAYETAARELHEQVGEADPLWDSAVAMWTEMSPERQLFADSVAGEDDIPSAAGAASAIVDITADTDAGTSTLSMSPGSDEVLESTQVGLGPVDPEDDAGGLDFDLGAEEFDVGDNDFLDLTATADSDGMLDLTAGLDEEDIPGFTTESSELPSADTDVLDITSSGPLSGDDLLDITGGSPESQNLLDVTKTGGPGLEHGDDILNITSPNLDSGDLDLAEIDFDISDTADSLIPEAGSDDADLVFDITSPEVDDETFNLDFDIGALENEALILDTGEARDETLDISGGLDFDSDIAASIEDGLDLNIPDGVLPGSPEDIETVEMEAVKDLLPDATDLNETSLGELAEPKFDLSLQSVELDDLTSNADLEESEIEFDLALEDTTEMNRMVIDDTLELPKPNTPDETLEDLAKSMEESMADLDLSADDLDGEETGELDFSYEDLDGEEIDELDLSLADTRGGLDLDLGELSIDDAPKLDFDLDDIDLDIVDPADTVAMDLSQSTAIRRPDESTLLMPADGTVEVQNDSDEIDTKLNLAKAYIELGDNDGARSILDEVLRDGAGKQRAEAQTLIDQL
ncbi:MAG: pilus assembly protein FimV [Gammaproteobacteria bacterium]|jgi:pilus assembly protein FimV